MIKAIVLDLDGVYYKKGSFWPKYLKWVNSQTEIDISQLDQIFRGGQIFKDFRKGQVSEGEYWNYIENSLQKDINREEHISHMAKGFVVDQELLSLVLKIKEDKGIMLGICSNTDISTTKSRRLNNIDPGTEFSFQILSYEVGYRKPSKEIFEKVVEECNCLPSEIIYVDDNPEKISGAADLGINTHIYTNIEEFKKFLESFGLYKL